MNERFLTELTVSKNWIISITQQYLKPFDFAQINEQTWIELLELDGITYI